MKNKKKIIVLSGVAISSIVVFLFILYLTGFNEKDEIHSDSSMGQSKSSMVSTISTSSNPPASNNESASEEIFYLHKSDLKLPSKSTCLKAQKQALHGLTDAQIKTVQGIIRDEHVRIESCLLGHVKLLKSSSDTHWEFLEHTGVISIPGEAVVNNQWAKSTILLKLDKIHSMIQDETVKADFKRMEETLTTAIDTHDLYKLFAYHEILHDYDYWVINYPAFYPTAPAPDWGGIETYFGTPSLISNTEQ